MFNVQLSKYSKEKELHVMFNNAYVPHLRYTNEVLIRGFQWSYGASN